MLLQAKGWTAVVLISLSLGIGANTALFSAINGLLLKKLPVSDPDTLVRFRYAGPNQMRTDVLVYGFTAPDARGRQVEPTFSYPMYLQFVADNQTMSDLFACAPFGRVNVVVNGQAEIASGFISSGNYYQVLGVTARLGRTITPDDDRPTAAPVAVISHKYWMSRFGGSPDVVGTPISINNVPVTVVGVLPPGFAGVEQAIGDAPDVSVPLALEPQFNAGANAPPSLVTRPTFWWLQVMGRLKPGVTAAQVHGNLAGVFQPTARAGFDSYLSSLSPEERSRSSLQDRTQVPELLVDSGSRGIYEVERDGPPRRHHADRGRGAGAADRVCQCRQPAALARDGAATGTVGAAGARRDACAVGPPAPHGKPAAGRHRRRARHPRRALGTTAAAWPAGQASPLDWRVMAFVIAVTTATGVVFGLAPALRATRTDVSSALKESSRSVAASRSVLGRSLVVAQVAISLVLLIGAGLFLRSLQNLRQVDVGFNPRNVLLFRVNPALNRYDGRKAEPPLRTDRRAPSRDRRRAFGRVVEQLPHVGPQVLGEHVHPGPHLCRATSATSSIGVVVSPTFFETMEIPLVAGRGFTPRDNQDAPRVVVINEAAARKYFPNESPIGRRIGSTLESSGSQEIVGVLRDAKYNSVRDAAVPTRYMPFLQGFQGTATFEVRTAGDPLAAIAGVREAVRQVDPNLPLMNVTTQLDEVEGRFLQEKVFAQAYTLFGGLALIVAVGRPVRLDVVQRRAPDERDRHPHGAWRPAAGRVAAGAARIDDPRGRRRARSASAARSLPAVSSPTCCSASRPPIRRRWRER